MVEELLCGLLGFAEIEVVPLPTMGFLASLMYGLICVVVAAPAPEANPCLIVILLASFWARIASTLLWLSSRAS